MAAHDAFADGNLVMSDPEPAAPVVPPLDPRLNAYRPDLADERLQGRVQATRFVAGWRAQVGRAVIPMRSQPHVKAGLVNEALLGERLRAFEIADGWAFVQLERDGYVGYAPAEALLLEISEPTHRVQAVGTFVYPDPDIKSPPLMHVPLGSELLVVAGDERFQRLSPNGYVIARHVVPKDQFNRDFVEVAERFIGVPYLWGGRTRIGLDCSGLLQIALEAAGQKAPRDSDMQQAALGTVIPNPDDLETLERGDLVFWPGHVGVMVDVALLLHANAHHMAVAVEPLSAASERIAKTGVKIAAIKRIARTQGPT